MQVHVIKDKIKEGKLSSDKAVRPKSIEHHKFTNKPSGMLNKKLTHVSTNELKNYSKAFEFFTRV